MNRPFARSDERTYILCMLAKRVLLCDFDGVLHPTLGRGDAPAGGPLVATPHFGWIPALAGALRGHDDVALVVHSTWRHDYDDELREVLGVLGSRLIGATSRSLQRYESILAWLVEYPVYASYRILDDDPSEFPVPLPAELILRDPASGVAAPAVLKALRAWVDGPRAGLPRTMK